MTLNQLKRMPMPLFEQIHRIKKLRNQRLPQLRDGTKLNLLWNNVNNTLAIERLPSWPSLNLKLMLKYYVAI
jgi:hypothetical protein